MQAFNGTYINWNGVDNLTMYEATYKARPDLALKELKLFRKIARTEKKMVNEEIRVLRMNQRVEKVSWGPLGRGGGKLGFFVRTAQTISRHTDRVAHERTKLPLEAKKQIVEKILLGLDTFELMLLKENG